MERQCDMSNVYIFDLDGTLADVTHRLHHIRKSTPDWNSFNHACEDDTPIPHVVELNRILSVKHGIIICSGRSNDVENKTVSWLIKHSINYDKLYMRRAKDFRSDEIVKKEMHDHILGLGHCIKGVFDDRDKVVNMWRENGIPCYQVAKGDF